MWKDIFLKKKNKGFIPFYTATDLNGIRDRTGFTFIELIIAITIFASVAVSLYYTLNTGIRLWKREKGAIGNNQRLRVFFDLAETDLQNLNITTPVGKEEDIESKCPIWQKDKMSFIANIDVKEAERASSGLVKIEYIFDAETRTISRNLYTPSSGFKEAKLSQVVLKDVSAMSLEYCLRSESDEEEYTWGEWEREGESPRGVKLEIELSDKKDEKGVEFTKIIYVPMGAVTEKSA